METESLIEAYGVDQLARQLAQFLARRWRLPEGMRQTQDESLIELVGANSPLMEQLTRNTQFVVTHSALVLALIERHQAFLAQSRREPRERNLPTPPEIPGG